MPLATDNMLEKVYSNLMWEYVDYFKRLACLHYMVDDISDLDEVQIGEMWDWGNEIGVLYPLFGQCIRDLCDMSGTSE